MTTKAQLIKEALELVVPFTEAELNKMRKADIESVIDSTLASDASDNTVKKAMAADTTKKDGKTSAGVNADIQKANELALKLFPMPKLKEAFGAMDRERKAEANAKDARSNAALTVVELAVQFAADNAEADTETVLAGWKAHSVVLAHQLATAGNSLAELVERKDGSTTGRFVQYGQNVMSQAKGAIEFEARFADVGEGETGSIVFEPSAQSEAVAELVEQADCSSYGEVRKAVTAYRAARKEAEAEPMTEAEQERELALLQIDAAWAELRELIGAEDATPALLESTLAWIEAGRESVVAHLNAPADVAEAA